MSIILYPFNIVNGDLEDAGPVMANFAAVTAVVNGSLELGTNVLAGAPSAQTGGALSGGSSLSALRADAQFIIRGVETLTADPSSGNFDGRVYYNTSTHKLRQYVSSAYQTVSNLSATELVHHAAQHAAGGDDVLNPPMAQATRTSDQTISNSGTGTAVAFNATDKFDTDTMHDTSTNNSRITFTHAGVYRISFSVAWAANSTGDRHAWIRLNGTSVLAGDAKPASANGNSANSATTLYKATAADYAEVFVWQNSGSSLNVLGTGTNLGSAGGSIPAPCFFSAEFIGSGT